MWQRLKALPPYFGGKRKLLGQIFKHLPRPDEAPIFIDAFLGGGSVSLFAKARGYRVISNDIALRSYIVGKSLIENDRVMISKDDLIRLFNPNGNEPHFIEKHFAPDVVTTKHATFLDMAFPNASAAPGVKKWLLLLLLIKYILRMRPMGNFGAKTIIQQAENNHWEEMNTNYLRDLLSRNICGHPKTVAEKLRQQINRGIFSNGQRNEVYRSDVFTFLKQIEGDVLYLDPPYAGTSAYEASLKSLDSMIEGKIVAPKPNAFSKADAIEVLEQLLEAAKRFHILVLSYGNAEIDLEKLVKLVGSFKPVVAAEEIRYVHLTGLSGEEHRKRNRELLVVARGSR